MMAIMGQTLATAFLIIVVSGIVAGTILLVDQTIRLYISKATKRRREIMAKPHKKPVAIDAKEWLPVLNRLVSIMQTLNLKVIKGPIREGG